MTLDQILMAIMRTFNAPVQVRQENTQAFTAGFGNDWDSALTSECRPTPEAAIRRFHEKLVQRAEEGHRNTEKHLRSLATVPSPAGGDPHG